MKKNKLQKILAGISYTESGAKDMFMDRFHYIMPVKEMKRIADKLEGNDVKVKIQSIIDSVSSLKDELKKNENGLNNSLNQKIDDLKSKMIEYRTANLEKLGTLSAEMDELKKSIREISQRKVEIPNYENQIGEIENKLGELVITLKEETKNKIENTLIESKKTVSNLEEEIKKLRRDAMSAIAGKGGSTPFQVNVNSSVISTRYADINFQQFGNIGWAAVNDDDNKRVNIRASILVSGGSGSGITRTVSVLSVSSILAAAATTDYTFFTNVGVNLTLPTAIGNTNRYSIKNMVVSSVLISAAVGQDIDGATTALLENQYEAVDIISNGSVFGIY